MDELSNPPEQMIKLNVLIGRVELDSWLEFRGNRVIGMGRTRRYDRNGALVEMSKPTPSGVEMVFA